MIFEIWKKRKIRILGHWERKGNGLKGKMEEAGQGEDATN